MKYSMNLMTANPFSPSPGTTATAQFQKQPLLQTSRKGLNHLRDERRCNPLGLTKSFLKKRIGSVCFFSVRCINPRNIIRRDDF
jgi:hypothetical protein